MKHDFPPINGRITRIPLLRDPLDEPTNEELGITPFPLWVRVFVWMGVFSAGAMFWKWTVEALFALHLSVPQ